MGNSAWSLEMGEPVSQGLAEFSVVVVVMMMWE